MFYTCGILYLGNCGLCGITCFGRWLNCFHTKIYSTSRVAMMPSMKEQTAVVTNILQMETQVKLKLSHHFICQHRSAL